MLALQKNIAIIIRGDRNRHIDFITHTVPPYLLYFSQNPRKLHNSSRHRPVQWKSSDWQGDESFPHRF